MTSKRREAARTARAAGARLRALREETARNEGGECLPWETFESIGVELEKAPVAKGGKPYQKSTRALSAPVNPTLAVQVKSRHSALRVERGDAGERAAVDRGEAHGCRSSLDGRTAAAIKFDRLVAKIESDLGGKEQLSQIELGLIQAFVGAQLLVDSANAHLLKGDAIDVEHHGAVARRP